MYTFNKLTRNVTADYLAIVCLFMAVLLSGTTAAGTTEEDAMISTLSLTNTATDVSVPDILGRRLVAAEISALDSHIFANGEQLPEGQGTIEAGKSVYQQQCASCHGGKGEGGRALELVGDRALLITEFPDKGIGVYWPNAPTLFQYIQRAMPPDKPGLLSNDELYSLIGYLLYLNELLPENATINRHTLSDIELPNRDGFLDQYPVTYKAEK